MKINTTTSLLETSGIDKTKINKAKISTNNVMFDVLINKMYKDKISTIVREYLANAIDACIEAGSAVPVEIHGPTLVEPWFSIKDYGVGISDKDIVDTYGNFGESSKRDSNALIGCLGLGSKTGYIYNGQFTVTTVKNGIKIIYVFFMNEKGEPCNTCLFRGTTTEENGTEVKIAASNAKDFDEFKKAINYYSGWCTYPVKCNGDLGEKRVLAISHDNFGFCEKPVCQDGNMLVVIGGIPYPVSINMSIGDMIYGTRFNALNNLRLNHLVLFAEIGQISFISSREEVEYTQETKNCIIEFIKKVSDWYTTIYLKSKTKFWLSSNIQSWERRYAGNINYGFDILYKCGTWNTSKETKAYKKYIVVESFSKKPWKSYIDKIPGCSTYNTAFVLSKDREKLISIGCAPSDILELPKIIRQRKDKANKIKVIDAGVGRRFKYIYINEKDFNKADYYNITQKELNCFQHKDAIEQYFRKKGSKRKLISIINDAPSDMKKILAETSDTFFNVKTDLATQNLKKLGYIQYPENSIPSYSSIYGLYEKYGLINKYDFKFGDKFPLLGTHTAYNVVDSNLWETDAIDYVNHKIEKNPSILNKDGLKVLKLRVSKV